MSGTSWVLNPRPAAKGPSAQRLCHWNTKFSLNICHNFGEYTLNFVLKAGILKPVTSPSISWTILFVCTRSCKMD